MVWVIHVCPIGAIMVGEMTRSLAIPREVLKRRVSESIPIPDWVRDHGVRESAPIHPPSGMQAPLGPPQSRDAVMAFIGSDPVPRHTELDVLDAAIRALHVRLRFYAENAARDPEIRGRYEATLAQLRALRQQETRTLLNELDRNVDWRPGEGKEAIREAKALIQKYAHTAAADDASNDHNPAASST